MKNGKGEGRREIRRSLGSIGNCLSYVRHRTVSHLESKSFCKSDPIPGNSVYLSDRVGGQARAELCALSAVSPRLGGGLRDVMRGPAVEGFFPCCGKRASIYSEQFTLCFCIWFWPTNQVLWTTPEEAKG